MALGIMLMLGTAVTAFGQPQAGGPAGQPKGKAGMAPGMPGMMGKGKMEMMNQMPKLTKDQRKQLFDLHFKFFNETAQFKFDLGEKHQELNDLWDADSPDAKAILAKWSEIDALERKLREKTVDFRIKVRKIAGKNAMGGMGMGMGMGTGMGMGMCPCMGGGMMGDNMMPGRGGMGMGMCSGMGCGMMGDMMPGMGGMGQGQKMIRIEKRIESPGGESEGDE
jgi:Spy/CpxP family protein refolding chaperone